MRIQYYTSSAYSTVGPRIDTLMVLNVVLIMSVFCDSESEYSIVKGVIDKTADAERRIADIKKQYLIRTRWLGTPELFISLYLLWISFIIDVSGKLRLSGLNKRRKLFCFFTSHKLLTVHGRCINTVSTS